MLGESWNFKDSDNGGKRTQEIIVPSAQMPPPLPRRQPKMAGSGSPAAVDLALPVRGHSEHKGPCSQESENARLWDREHQVLR